MKDVFNTSPDAIAFGGINNEAVTSEFFKFDEQEEQRILTDTLLGVFEGVTGLPSLTITDCAVGRVRSQNPAGNELGDLQAGDDKPILSDLITDYEAKLIAENIKNDGTLGSHGDRLKLQSVFDRALEAGPEAVEKLIEAINKELESSGYKVSGNVIEETKMVESDVGHKSIVPQCANAKVSSLNIFLTDEDSTLEDLMNVGYHIHPPYSKGWVLADPQ